jgi:hypothetical protein
MSASGAEVGTMTDDPQEAARRSLDPERLLPGEDLQSVEPDDAAHWARIYRELMQAKQTLADDLAASLREVGDEAHAELESVDMVMIKVQLDRFQRRFRYWSTRQRELQATGQRES